VYFSYDGSLGAALTKKPGEAARADDAAALEAAAEAAAVEGEPAVLKDLDLTMEAGKTYALVGPSGAGKSTTCALLPRFYDVDAGRILIDGQDISQVTVASVREAVGLVQQDVYLFDGTIGENIAYGRPNATFDEVIEAAKLANIHDFICTLPDGYNTRVGERGSRLSGGQKQRVAIARVFLKDPRILVLDEATSALDNESEAAVQESLRRLSQGRTTIIIAHRLSTIRDADVIVTMEDGRVSELGTHDELLAKGGTYARYYTMQFGAHEAHGEAAATAAAATCA
jgi:ATP-binding cassette subfamily B protein